MSPRCRGGDGRRLQIEDLHLLRLDAPMLERGQQAVMGGGDKRHRNALADQILRAFDVILHHQRFGAAELRGDEEHFDGEFLAGATASGLEPILPICTSPEANARSTLEPLSNLRQSTVAPDRLAKLFSACATLAGSADVWYATVTSTA